MRMGVDTAGPFADAALELAVVRASGQPGSEIGEVSSSATPSGSKKARKDIPKAGRSRMGP